jgi:hypothetical protein
MEAARLPKVTHLFRVCLITAALAGTVALADTARAAGRVPDTDQPDAAAGVFVNLLIGKTELYVGESVPVVIEVGAQDNVVAALDSPPSLRGDAFTLNVLSGEPERERRVIDGKPCTLLTWHSVLAAVKPGELSFTIEAPFTVQVPLPTHGEASYADEATGDPYADPAFQSLLHNATVQAIVATSRPLRLHILALPTANRPAGWSGAVGHFTISSELSNRRTVVGEPLTLRLHVQGAGNFDRVNSDMLSTSAEWRMYPPTAAFTAAESTGYRGDKVFAQSVVATRPGTRNLPALEFSYFDPQTRRYAIARAPPLSIEVAPEPAAQGALGAPTPQAAHAAVKPPVAALARRDRAAAGATTDSLIPPYLQPRLYRYPLLLIVVFAGMWFKAGAPRPRLPRPSSEESLRQMADAAQRGDSEEFFQKAGRVLREAGVVDHDTELRELLRLADEANYAGELPRDLDLQRCRQVVLRCLAAQRSS